MPNWRAKLTCFAIAAVATALLVAGCGGNTWSREFAERMEGSSAAVEKDLPYLQSDSTDEEWFVVGGRLGREMFFKSQLIAELTPPPGCEKVQQKGKSEVFGLSNLAGGLFKNMTPELQRHLPGAFEERIEELQKLKREAAHCATG